MHAFKLSHKKFVHGGVSKISNNYEINAYKLME